MAGLLPSGALAEVLQHALRAGAPGPGQAWVVLAVWALVLPPAAARMSAGAEMGRVGP